MEKRKRIAAIAFLILLVMSCAASKLIYDYVSENYLVFREKAFYLTYEPFSHKLFNIDPDSVARIYAALEHGEGNTLDFNSKKDIETISEYLNSFRYTFWVPGPGEQEIPSGTWHPNIYMKRKDSVDRGESIYDDLDFSFENNRFRIFGPTKLVYY